MSVYPPPNYTEPISVFNPINWEQEDTGILTRAEADLLYLHYPVAQGLETLQDIVVNGNSTFNNPIDIVDAGEITNLNMDGTTNAFIITNNVNSGLITFKTKNIGGTLITPLTFNSVDMTIGTTNPPTQTATQPSFADSSTKIPTTAWIQGAIDAKIPPSLLGLNNTWTGTNAFNNVAPITSTATQPSFTDSSTKIPTTAWVQGAITAHPTSTTSTLAYYRTGLIAGNQKPLATPLVISVNTGSQTGSGITMCPLVFRITCSYTNGNTPANQQDSNGVATFCNTCSCIFNYFVYNSQPVVSGTNVNYLNNSMGGSATANTSYYNNVVYGNNYGRPFWTTNLSNEANVSVVFPFTFTGTPFLNGLKTIQFDPPAVGYPATSFFYWEWTIEVLNKANFAGMITSTGFDVNLNC